MALLGISLLVASAVLFCFRRPQWFLSFLASWRQSPSIAPPPVKPVSQDEKGRKEDGSVTVGSLVSEKDITTETKQQNGGTVRTDNSAAVPPPPPPAVRSAVEDSETTPKASAAALNDSIPTFTLAQHQDHQPEPPRIPANPPFISPLPQRGPSNPMAPPPRPSSLMAPPARPPTLAPLPSSSRPSPLPSRLGAGLQPRQPGSSTLAPLTHTAKPTKPSRQVILTPGHSPLDWARLSTSPTADLRNLPGGLTAPYLRVTPSMLKKMTGRKGKDAWTVLGGKVYNMSPYVPFHPGGEAELLRGAARDGTRLFGEVHPWVNYEGMLQSCLVGVLVGEAEAEGNGGMEEMD